MALSWAHTSAKAADIAELLLLNKHPSARSIVRAPPNRAPISTLTVILTKHDPDYHQNLLIASVVHAPHFHQISRKSVK